MASPTTYRLMEEELQELRELKAKVKAMRELQSELKFCSQLIRVINQRQEEHPHPIIAKLESMEAAVDAHFPTTPKASS